MQTPSLKKNFVMNILLTISSVIFPIITFPYISRILGPTGTGKVSFATSVISYFSMFAQLGIPTYGIRACAQVRDNREELTKTAQELLIINLFMDVLSYIALALCLIFIPRFKEDRPLYVIISATILLTSIGMEWLYKALEQYTYITVRSVIFKFIALIAMFLLVHRESDYTVYGAISIFAASASNVLNFINAHKYIDMKPTGNYHFERHLKPVGIFFAMACATTVYTNLDNVMLGFMKTDDDVGFYNAAVKIKTVMVSVVTSLGTVLLPRASYYIEHKMMDEFKSISRKALTFTVLVASPITLYFILFAKEGIYFLSGSAYTESILPMQIIMPTVLFIGITNILGIEILVPLGKEKTVLYSVIAGAVVDVIINAMLIPEFASSGAAAGTLAAEFAVLVYQYHALKDEVSDTFRSMHFGRMVLALGLGAGASLWVKYIPLPGQGAAYYFMVLAISFILFFGVYGIFLLLRKEEIIVEMWETVRHKLKRR